MRVVDHDNFFRKYERLAAMFFNLPVILFDLFSKQYASVHALGTLGPVIMWHESCHSYHHPEAQPCCCLKKVLY